MHETYDEMHQQISLCEQDAHNDSLTSEIAVGEMVTKGVGGVAKAEEASEGGVVAQTERHKSTIEDNRLEISAVTVD